MALCPIKTFVFFLRKDDDDNDDDSGDDSLYEITYRGQ
jgi:hypothetical protein